MSRVGFEAAIPVFERVETFHSSDGRATVIGTGILIHNITDRHCIHNHH
jgi:hypothetical protein